MRQHTFWRKFTTSAVLLVHLLLCSVPTKNIPLPHRSCGTFPRSCTQFSQENHQLQTLCNMLGNRWERRRVGGKAWLSPIKIAKDTQDHTNPSSAAGFIFNLTNTSQAILSQAAKATWLISTAVMSFRIKKHLSSTWTCFLYTPELDFPCLCCLYVCVCSHTRARTHTQKLYTHILTLLVKWGRLFVTWGHCGWSSRLQRTVWVLRLGFNVKVRIGFRSGSGSRGSLGCLRFDWGAG